MHKVRDKEFLIQFGNSLRLARKNRNLTQEDLAGLSGLALSQIARLETGELNTSISTVNVILKALKAEANELFKEVE